MSEEKLYAVKNHSDEFWEFSDSTGFWSLKISNCPTTTSKDQAEQVANERGGHVVTFVEEPEKVVLTKEQAEIVKGANESQFPANYISRNSGEDEEELLMRAYVNGYTMAKEKKYLVYKVLSGKQKNKIFGQAYRSSIDPGTTLWLLNNEVKSWSWAQFTEPEIEHYGLQDCEKEEVTDNDDEV